MPVLAKVKARTGRLWTYVRDDRPFGGQGPPAVLFDYTPTRHGEHPRRVLAGWTGVLQADAFSGHNALYAENRKPAPILEAACWAHGRRDFFDLARLTKAPIAVEIVRRIDELFAIERVINGKSSDERRAVRQERSKPLVVALEAYMREQLRRLSPKNKVAKPIRYMLSRWASFTRFLDDGRVCLSNNAAERALRCVAVARSFCPCRAGSRSLLPMARASWAACSPPLYGAARRGRVRPRRGGARRGHGGGGVDARSGRVRRNDVRRAALVHIGAG